MLSRTCRVAQNVPQIPELANIQKWDRDDLVKWIQLVYPNLLDSVDLQAFKAIKLRGNIFVRQDSAFFERCGIAVGVSKELELIIQTIQRKAGKHKADFDNEGLNPIRFSNISQVYTELHEASSKVSLDIAKYCDASQKQTLPFLFAGQVPTERFHLDENRHFEFYGRKLFRRLYNAAKSMHFLKTRLCFLHGTLGAGKSHLLAALACVLRKEGMRVVYLPDCQGLLNSPFQYLRHALRLAFFDTLEIQEFLIASECIEDLEKFCNDAASAQHRVLFIIDQVNALDSEDGARDRYSNKRKYLVRAMLENITAEHLKITSYTGDYMHAAHDTYHQSNERISMYGGLSKSEMESWWREYAVRLPLDFNEADREAIEALTGRVPIFLHVILAIDLSQADEAENSSDSEGEEDLPARTATKVYSDSVSRVQDAFWQSAEVMSTIRDFIDFTVTRSTNNLVMFREAVSACLIRGPVGPAKEKLLDWRYFFVANGSGNVTSGVVREAATKFLRSTMGAHEFLSRHWYRSLHMAGKNPSVLGFFTETMLLSWIANNGCSAAGSEFQSLNSVLLFDDSKPVIRHDSCSLYIPTSFSYRAVSAILVMADSYRDKATITAVQITISKTHSDSEAKFFADWEWWHGSVGCSTVRFRFLWIVEDVGQNPAIESIQPVQRPLRGKTKVLCPGFERRYASVKDVSKDIGQALEKARTLAR